VRRALEATGARVYTAAAGSPRPVQSAADALRWLLDGFASAEAADEPTDRTEC
jgi:hypothetical protein